MGHDEMALRDVFNQDDAAKSESDKEVSDKPTQGNQKISEAEEIVSPKDVEFQFKKALMEKTYGSKKVVEVDESDDSRLSAANVTDISMQNMITNFMMDNTRIDSKQSKKIVNIHG